VVDLLVELLNRNLLTEIPSQGSVGASGDLVPLAHMARVLTGLGHVRSGERRMRAEEALKDKGLAPAVLRCKEGLALVNGTSVMTGLAALATQEAAQLLSWAEFLTACLFQALWASPEVLCEQAHKARGFRGQSASAARIADHVQSHPVFRRQIQEHEWGTQRVVNMFLAWRKELIRILKRLGMKSVKELVGRTDCLVHLDYMKKLI